MKTHTIPFLVLISLIFCVQAADAHCQAPCGIYDDHARFRAILEDARTVKKACVKIGELAIRRDPQSFQQFVRWVDTKERHAERIIETVCDYYLTQRVRPEKEDYLLRLQRHHAVILAAMKAKQSAEVEAGNQLLEAVEVLNEYYPYR